MKGLLGIAADPQLDGEVFNAQLREKLVRQRRLQMLVESFRCDQPTQTIDLRDQTLNCQFGCGKPATYITERTSAHCCSPRARDCPSYGTFSATRWRARQ